MCPNLAHGLTAVHQVPPTSLSLIQGGIGADLKSHFQLLCINVQRFRGGFVFKAHRLLTSGFQSNKEEDVSSRAETSFFCTGTRLDGLFR